MGKGFKFFACLLLCLSLLPVMPALAAGNEDTLPAETEPAATLILSGVEDLLAFAESCRLDSYSQNLIVELEGDIDLTGVEFSGIPIFGGIFHGNSHRISGLNITVSGSHQGLFRYLEDTALVTDLTVTGTVTPGGSRGYVGGIAGTNAGTLENCQFSGEVSGTDNVGGIAGINTLTGVLSHCRTEGMVHGNHFVGGIAGDNQGVVRGCSNYALINTTVKQNNVSVSDITIDSLTGSESVITVTDMGGIAGNSTGLIRDCENHADVGYQHIGYNIGGIAGTQSGYLTGCKNFADIRGRKEVGGIVGQMEPSTQLRFQEDTLQILRGQLDTLSVLTTRASANVHNSTADLNQEILNISDQAKTALDALNTLLPSEGTLPDIDTVTAVRNTLSASLNAISASMHHITAIYQESASNLSSDLQAISNQVQAMGATLNRAEENLNGSFTDISDLDTDEDTTGKVALSINCGSVLGDWNVGGIVGAISVENDMDTWDDLDILGDSSLNFYCDARAVALRCENSGTVTGEKENAGGIVGWASMGLVKQCQNTGPVEAENARYAGGIAGLSQGYIRRCAVKAAISGASCAGGIAGSGSTVTDCLSMVRLRTGSEKTGAILGTALEGGEIACNYYLPTEQDLGGIDGISYDLMAQPLREPEFFCLENLPAAFQNHTVRFVFADGTRETRTVAHGKALEDTDMPVLPAVEGSQGYWENKDGADLTCVTFDCQFTAVYASRLTTIKSAETRQNGLPVLLVQGSFALDAQIELEASGAPEELSAIECWAFSVDSDGSQLTLRYLPPENRDGEAVTVLVRTADDTWQEKASSFDGSYLVFTADEGENAFCIVKTPRKFLVLLVSVIAAVLATAAILLVWGLRRKKKKA